MTIELTKEEMLALLASVNRSMAKIKRDINWYVSVWEDVKEEYEVLEKVAKQLCKTLDRMKHDI